MPQEILLLISHYYFLAVISRALAKVSLSSAHHIFRTFNLNFNSSPKDKAEMCPKDTDAPS